MSEVINIEKIFHRSRDRIRRLGEVFTPEPYVEEMLEIISKNKRGVWSDEAIAFFEPCAGHGNIVVPIYKRRLDGIFKKANLSEFHEPAFYAVAHALNTLWAIDIDMRNVECCRTRVFETTIEFLKSKTEHKDEFTLITKKKKFFVHVLSAIKWHIDENETLSALSDYDSAKKKAGLTKTGSKWFANNGHRKLDFSLTWVEFYKQCEASRTTPIEFERASHFIDSFISGKTKGFNDFNFAKKALQTSESSINGNMFRKSRVLGG